ARCARELQPTAGVAPERRPAAGAPRQSSYCRPHRARPRRTPATIIARGIPFSMSTRPPMHSPMAERRPNKFWATPYIMFQYLVFGNVVTGAYFRANWLGLRTALDG